LAKAFRPYESEECVDLLSVMSRGVRCAYGGDPALERAAMEKPFCDTRPKRVVMVSTYPPRRCGLAAFSYDLRAALLSVRPGWRVDVVALDRDGIEYGDEVLTVIDQASSQSHLDAAPVIAAAGTDVVVIEHEYGIFGGTDGRFVVDLATQLQRRGVPYLVTAHTVPAAPTPGQAATLRTLCAGAAAVTAFTPAARETLVDTGLMEAARVAVVAHGAPAVLLDPAAADPPGPMLAETLRHLAGDPVLTTFGLIGPGKGLEQVIAALPMIVAGHPRVRYVIAGATHPEVLRTSGEAYRHGLTALARRSGVADHVVFVDAFLSEAELAHLLARTTIYLTPYRGMEQTSSGTLAFAIAAGCPVVSTPFQYAREMLADHPAAGVLVPPDDPSAIASAVSGLLDDPDRLGRARSAARSAGQRLSWTTVAARFAEVLATCPDRATRRLLPAPVTADRYARRPYRVVGRR
jgi:glycosyltransferase involved in cell wall biosynthesis